MNAMLERWIIFGVVAFSFLYAWRASAKAPITIHKVFHHTNADAKALELGSFVLYGEGFTKEPLKLHVVVSDALQEYRFVIPRVTVHDAEIRRKLQALRTQQGSHGYQLVVEDLKRPDEGLSVIFKFPKNRCEVSCTYTNSIQHEKGIIFHVYNRELKEDLKRCSSPVIRTVLHTPPRIFIDPGHGGDDKGAVATSGMTEKKVCLAVGKKVKKELGSLGYAVCMSREADRFIPLDERTHKASRFNADLVVSIHANSAPSIQAAGVEIFFLDPQLADQEKSLSPEMYAYLKKYYALRTASSQKLATALHTACNASLSAHNSVFKDRGIKTAVSQILLGAARPATLIEIGFLTNPIEARLLADRHYQSILAHAIAQGIHHYCVNMRLS